MQDRTQTRKSSVQMYDRKILYLSTFPHVTLNMVLWNLTVYRACQGGKIHQLHVNSVFKCGEKSSQGADLYLTERVPYHVLSIIMSAHYHFLPGTECTSLYRVILIGLI